VLEFAFARQPLERWAFGTSQYCNQGLRPSAPCSLAPGTSPTTRCKRRSDTVLDWCVGERCVLPVVSPRCVNEFPVSRLNRQSDVGRGDRSVHPLRPADARSRHSRRGGGDFLLHRMPRGLPHARRPRRRRGCRRTRADRRHGRRRSAGARRSRPRRPPDSGRIHGLPRSIRRRRNGRHGRASPLRGILHHDGHGVVYRLPLPGLRGRHRPCPPGGGVCALRPRQRVGGDERGICHHGLAAYSERRGEPAGPAAEHGPVGRPGGRQRVPL